MGLFRNRARKKREQAAPGLVEQRTRTVETRPEVTRREVAAETRPEVTRREVAAETRPDPDQPGWGRTLGQQRAAAGLLQEQTGPVPPQPEAAPREVTAEARPNPDKPGWGRALGQQIGKAHEDRADHE
jgi:hypothetical protein